MDLLKIILKIIFKRVTQKMFFSNIVQKNYVENHIFC